MDLPEDLDIIMDLPEDLDNLREKAWTRQHGRLQNRNGLRDFTQPHPHRPQSHTSSMAEQGGASGGGVSFTSSWGKDLSDSARKRYLESMMQGIMEMGMEGQNSDIDIIVEGQSFPCHKLLLAAGSPYFKSMFSSGMMETHGSRLELPDIEKDTFAAFREYIYTGNENITQDNVVELLRAAAIFQVEGLQKSCEQFLGTGMDNDNCLELFKISRTFGCHTLFEQCKPYVLEGFNGLWKTQEFMELEFDEVESIVKDDNLVPVNEEEICEAVLRWVKHDRENRKSFIGKLFRYIRMIQISPEYLIHELYVDDLLTDDHTCQRYLDEARNFHMLPARQQEYCSSRFQLRNSDDLEEVILIITEFDMEKTAQMYQDGKCLWAFSFQQERWYTIAPIPMDFNSGLEFRMVSFRNDLYLGGGTNHSKNLLHYDNERNEWTLCESMKRGRCGHVMAAVRESIFMIAGRNPKSRPGSSSHVLSTVEAYNIRSRKWESIGEVPTAVHSASSLVMGEKIFIFGGIQQDGTWTSDIQVFDTRKRESSIISQIPSNIPQPLKLVKLGSDYIILSDCQLYGVNIRKINEEKIKVEIKSLNQTLSKTLRPVLEVANYRGKLAVLTSTTKKPDVYSKMTLVDISQSPMTETAVSISSKNTTIPKPVLSCHKGIIDKQYMYHTYYQ